jgi:beta-aspartyl-peptidase (threonine type)
MSVFLFITALRYEVVTMPIALIVHGGAWLIPDEQVAPHIAGCRAALAAGWAVLERGGAALEAVEAAVRVMEDDPIFDAGTGSVLTSEGTVELDAALMDGRTLRYGAVANLRRIRNPITLARHVLTGPATMLVSEGAERYAMAQGMELIANEELIVERERQLYTEWLVQQATQQVEQREPLAVGHDTVGAIALDLTGNIVAANSTGGTPFKLPGRVGDTPLIGGGIYADAMVGGCCATGWGESITRIAMARRALEFMERGASPQVAAELAVRTLSHKVAGGSGGCIILNTRGQGGMAWNTRHMAHAYRVAGGEERWGV